MAKKDFSGGLSSLLGEDRQEQDKPRPQQQEEPTRQITKTSQVGTKDDETRATFIVNEADLEKIKAIAYWDRLQIKDVMAAALTAYINQYEKKNGPIQSIPTKK